MQISAGVRIHRDQEARRKLRGKGFEGERCTIHVAVKVEGTFLGEERFKEGTGRKLRGEGAEGVIHTKDG